MDKLTPDIDIVIDLLGSGHSVELPAKGYSMFPIFRPGDRVIVKPLAEGEFPEPGSVVVYIDNCVSAQGAGRRAQGHNDVMVMHRLVEIIADDSGELLFITRGDSRTEPINHGPRNN